MKAHHAFLPDSVGYIGHSLGCSVALALLASQPDRYSHVLRPVILLSPEARLYNTQNGGFRAFAALPSSDSIIASVGGVFPPQLPMQQFLTNLYCQNMIQPICRELFRKALSFNSDNHNQTRFPVILNHFPQSTSAKTFAYFIQAARAKRFFKFDYGPDENEQVYGQVCVLTI